MNESEHPESGIACAQDLLAMYGTLAVPHFQRGLVWDSSAVALLLESLYYSSPCGSIVLWSPLAPAGLGVPLDGKGDTLIVDGQQRIRSLHEVFGNGRPPSMGVAGGEDEDEAEDVPEVGHDAGDEASGDGIWCLNLARVPGLKERFEGGFRFKLFRRVRDPWMVSRRGTPPAGYNALLPLRWFLGQDDAALRSLLVQDEGPDAVLAQAVRAALERDDVRTNLRQMRTCRVFHLSRLSSESSVDSVVEIYNRINSAGRRVEAEERAFANLVGVHQGTLDVLRTFFQQVEEPAGAGSRPMLERDGLVQRQRENRFGFKLFMRAFCMVLAYHRDRSVGSSAMSFNVVTREALDQAKEHLPDVLKQTVLSLSSVRKVLQEDPLRLDDFRMLPDSTSLWPLLQLLIRFPDLAEGPKRRLASIALRLIIANLPQQRLLDLVARISRVRTASLAVACFDTGETGLEEVRRRIEAELKRAQSLQNRFTLCLYPLLRYRGATDFSYEANLSSEHAAALTREYGGGGLALSAQLRVEKQHLVPYSVLRAAYQIREGARPGRHEAHDIGNITYISAGLNSFETGIGSQPLALSDEPETNRQAHCISPEMVGYYEQVLGLPEAATGESNEAVKEAFRKMCAARRDQIQHGFREWLARIDEEGRGEPIPEVSPVMRRIAQRDEDVIQLLGLPSAVTEALITLCNVKGVRQVRKKDSRFCIGCKVPSGRNGTQLLRVNVPETAKPVIEMKATDERVEGTLKLCPPGVRLVKQTSRQRRYLVDPDHDGAAQVLLGIVQTLHKISAEAKDAGKAER